MTKAAPNDRIRIVAAAAMIMLVAVVRPTWSQEFDDGLIDRTRMASQMIPGEFPIDVRFQGIVRWSDKLSFWVEDAPSTMQEAVIGVFQIRFPNDWIMVDAAGDKEILFDEFSEEDYALAGNALRGASLIVITHEHHDHVAGLVRGPWANEIDGQAMLTREQLDTLVNAPNDPRIQISQEHADQFLSVTYDELLPIARGVVLIKAPGHTPGSQIVYINLESGSEVLLVGDIVWMTAALENGSEKPLGISSQLGEDREALIPQVRWLMEMQRSGVYVVVAHDAPALDELIEKGVIQKGLYVGDID